MATLKRLKQTVHLGTKTFSYKALFLLNLVFNIY